MHLPHYSRGGIVRRILVYLESWVNTKASGYLGYHCVDCDTSTAETIFIAYTVDMSCFKSIILLSNLYTRQYYCIDILIHVAG
ncbi:hypothetical protein Hanom_Chr03g00190681 [Helianthus anomalus]